MTRLSQVRRALLTQRPCEASRRCLVCVTDGFAQRRDRIFRSGSDYDRVNLGMIEPMILEQRDELRLNVPITGLRHVHGLPPYLDCSDQPKLIFPSAMSCRRFRDRVSQ